MLDSITGELIRKDGLAVVLRCNGLAYQVIVPSRTLRDLPEHHEATLFCHLVVREDTIKLYGFESLLERQIFLKLNSVAGVGAGTAVLLLSDLSSAEIINTIVTEQHLKLQKVKGIGAKTAKRIVLELRGKVEEMGISAPVEPQPEVEESDRLGRDLLNALMALGYSRAQAREASLEVLAEYPGKDKIEELIRSALAKLRS